MNDTKNKQNELGNTPGLWIKVIRRDIARTYPEHEFFKKKDGVGQEALFNVIKAYSIHDREVKEHKKNSILPQNSSRYEKSPRIAFKEGRFTWKVALPELITLQ